MLECDIPCNTTAEIVMPSGRSYSIVRLLVEYIKVMPEGKIVIEFKGGGEVEEVL